MILCDLDNVLATNRGRDIATGQPIHRTFVGLPPALLDIRQARVPIHIVTKKTEAEARQILAAIGLTVCAGAARPRTSRRCSVPDSSRCIEPARWS